MSLEQGPDTVPVSTEQKNSKTISRGGAIKAALALMCGIPLSAFRGNTDEIPPVEPLPEDWIPVCEIEEDTMEPFLDLVGVTPVDFLESLSDEEKDQFVVNTFIAAQTVPVLAEIVDVEYLESVDSVTRVQHIDRALEALEKSVSFATIGMVTRETFRVMNPEVQQRYIENILRHVRNRAQTETAREQNGLETDMAHCLALSDPKAVKMLTEMVLNGLTVAVAAGAGLFLLEDSGSLLITWGSLRFVLGYPNGPDVNMGTMYKAAFKNLLPKSANPIEVQTAQQILHESLCELALLTTTVVANKPKQNGKSNLQMPSVSLAPALIGVSAFTLFLIALRMKGKGTASAA